MTEKTTDTPTSAKQVAANRRNAALSTGPRTPVGKARSAANATKHGLTSRRVTLADEDETRFRNLRVSLIHELGAVGELEQLLVYRLAATLWRLNRVPGLEAELFGTLRARLLGEDAGLGGAWQTDGGPAGGSGGGGLLRLTRYETALERSATRLLEQLRRLQRQRPPLLHDEDEQEGRWPPDATPGALPGEAPAPQAPGAPRAAAAQARAAHTNVRNEPIADANGAGEANLQNEPIAEATAPPPA